MMRGKAVIPAVVLSLCLLTGCGAGEMGNGAREASPNGTAQYQDGTIGSGDRRTLTKRYDFKGDGNVSSDPRGRIGYGEDSDSTGDGRRILGDGRILFGAGDETAQEKTDDARDITKNLENGGR